MSSPSRTRRSLLSLVALPLALALGGCFRPMYGPTASGAPLREVLAAIEIGTVQAGYGQDRVTHYLRNELRFELDGSGVPAPKRYVLNIIVSESVQTPIVNTATGRASLATLMVSANYSLTKPDGTVIVPAETATGNASYDRNAQRFATLRAARDAEIRAAKMVAEQIKTRLALHLVNLT